MSSSEWSYSTTLTSSSGFTHQTEQENSQVIIIAIPISGYYTLSFGTKSHLEDFETVTPDSAKESDVVYCGCQFNLILNVHHGQQNDKGNKDQEVQVQYSISQILPLICNNTHKSKSNKMIHVTSTRIAHVVYISKGTTFMIHRFKYCIRNGDDQDCSGPFEFTLQLYIPHELSPQLTCVEHNNKEGDSTLNHNIDFHPQSFSKKPWVCVQCRRCFHSPKATRNHCISTHANNPNCLEQDYSDLIGPKIFHTPLQAVYEDDHIVIVNKPQGVPVQSGRWTIHSTDLLLPFRAKPGTQGALSKPRSTHRLDAATGGLLVVAKTHASESKMNQLFEQKVCQKRYRAIVFGKLILNQHDYTILSQNDDDDESYKGFGTIHVPVGNKPALTRYHIIQVTPYYNRDQDTQEFVTTVDLWPITGRRHQLRKHLQMIGHPIWGDLRYGPYQKCDKKCIRDVKADDFSSHWYYHTRMCLFAVQIHFPHPMINDKQVDAQMEEPLFYQDIREWLDQNKNGHGL